MNPGAVRIVADDLTGAADAVAPFASREAPARLELDAASSTWMDPRCRIVAVDAATRSMCARHAARTTGALTERAAGAQYLMKKIDSLLRGGVAAEVAALRVQFPERLLVVAPALPAQGRRTVDGMQDLGGKSVSVSAALTARVPARHVELATLRRGGLPLVATLERARGTGAAVICDAESDADLDAVVRAGSAGGEPAIWVGSGGLAAALARWRHHRCGTRAAEAEELLEAAAGPADRILVVVGSGSARARRQARGIAGGALEEVAAVTLAEGDDDAMRRVSERLAAQLHRRPTVVVGVGGSHVRGEEVAVARGVARAVLPAAEAASALILTGGETARAVLDALGIRALDVVAELEPGVALARPATGGSPWVVTKAGSFGDDAVLGRLATRLHELGALGV